MKKIGLFKNEGKEILEMNRKKEEKTERMEKASTVGRILKTSRSAVRNGLSGSMATRVTTGWGYTQLIIMNDRQR